MIVSLLIFILPYSQPSLSSYHTLFVIFMLLTIHIYMNHPPSYINLTFTLTYIILVYLTLSLGSRPSYDIHVSQLMFDSIASICSNPKYYRSMGYCCV